MFEPDGVQGSWWEQDELETVHVGEKMPVLSFPLPMNVKEKEPDITLETFQSFVFRTRSNRCRLRIFMISSGCF